MWFDGGFQEQIMGIKMPSTFLCHASENKSLVEPIQLAHLGTGYEVFYDEHSLPPDGDYQVRIHD